MYDRVGDEEKPNGGVSRDGKTKHKEEREELGNGMSEIGER